MCSSICPCPCCLIISPKRDKEGVKKEPKLLLSPLLTLETPRLLSSLQYHVRIMGCKVIPEGAESQVLSPTWYGGLLFGVFVKMGSSYLKDTKAHFENNKRSKEYTAHQSKVSKENELIGYVCWSHDQYQGTLCGMEL